MLGSGPVGRRGVVSEPGTRRRPGFLRTEAYRMLPAEGLHEMDEDLAELLKLLVVLGILGAIGFALLQTPIVGMINEAL